MAERVAAWEAARSYNYIFAYEESYGYMMGDYVRDKDAVTAAMLVAEMAAYYHDQGMTPLDAMNALYEKYGWFQEYTMNLVMPGLDGLQKMKDLMAELRANPPKEIGGQKVIRTRDYSDGSVSVAGLGKVGTTPFFGSNVLYFELADGSSFIVRPYGTEPKIKIYLLVRGDSREQCEERIQKYTEFAETLKK
jgi:phosphoglucomutase